MRQVNFSGEEKNDLKLYKYIYHEGYLYQIKAVVSVYLINPVSAWKSHPQMRKTGKTSKILPLRLQLSVDWVWGVVHNSGRFCKCFAKSYFFVEAEDKDGKISPQVNGQIAEQFTVGHKENKI